MSAAPGRPPAGRPPALNAASPQTDCWPSSHHLLQHQDPRRRSHAQTILGDAGSHDGLALRRRGAAEMRTGRWERPAETLVDEVEGVVCDSR